MNYSEFKELAHNVGQTNFRDVAEQMRDDESDFTSGNLRFIHMDDIDQIMQEELKSDLYTLGYFNADFLSGILKIDIDVIEAMQKAEAFEAIGKLIISLDAINELQMAYASIDSYGHHFAHYDHQEHEVGKYYMFQTN